MYLYRLSCCRTLSRLAQQRITTAAIERVTIDLFLKKVMTPGGWGGDKWLVWLCCLIAVRAESVCVLFVWGLESGCFFWGRRASGSMFPWILYMNIYII